MEKEKVSKLKKNIQTYKRFGLHEEALSLARLVYYSTGRPEDLLALSELVLGDPQNSDEVLSLYKKHFSANKDSQDLSVDLFLMYLRALLRAEEYQKIVSYDRFGRKIDDSDEIFDLGPFTPEQVRHAFNLINRGTEESLLWKSIYSDIIHKSLTTSIDGSTRRKLTESRLKADPYNIELILNNISMVNAREDLPDPLGSVFSVIYSGRLDQPDSDNNPFALGYIAKRAVLIERDYSDETLSMFQRLEEEHPLFLFSQMNVLEAYIILQCEKRDRRFLFSITHKLSEMHPSSYLTWFSAGCYYYVSGKFGQAQIYFSKCVSLNKRFEHGWLGLGHAFSMVNEGENAASIFRSCANEFPDSHYPHLFLAMEYRKTMQRELAKNSLRKALKLDKNNPHVLNEIGVMAFQMGEYKRAKGYFLKVLSQKNTRSEIHAIAMVNKGHCELEMFKYSLAVESFEKGLEMFPSDGRLLESIGFAYQCMGELETAIRYYERALNKPKSNAGFIKEMMNRCFGLLD